MSAIADLLHAARLELDRVRPEELANELGAGALLIDIRPKSDRAREGTIPGAIAVERNVLEWRLDPTSPDRIAEADGPDRRVIVFCNDGYASTLAAVSLHAVGLRRATDLEGGYRLWRRMYAKSRS